MLKLIHLCFLYFYSETRAKEEWKVRVPTWGHYALVAENFENVNVENSEAELKSGREHLDDSWSDHQQKGSD